MQTYCTRINDYRVFIIVIENVTDKGIKFKEMRTDFPLLPSGQTDVIRSMAFACTEDCQYACAWRCSSFKLHLYSAGSKKCPRVEASFTKQSSAVLVPDSKFTGPVLSAVGRRSENLSSPHSDGRPAGEQSCYCNPRTESLI
ncbi:hypothetical protein AVEN_82033-1 [Araneus ventricosus]|uniref:Uncharacterized protein n=1 Tax=Araneus ventricosus TaxID=182803 RepID=A0A4Y2VN91_ARAVE|nr:hypothetical protein AVEN_82033-1 [Araneus ventricosus]